MGIETVLWVESPLDEDVLRKLLAHVGGYHVLGSFVVGGRSYLQEKAPNLNQAAQGFPYVMLIDLDRDECPPTLIANWLPHGRHPNLVLRVAVRAVEAWLLADRATFAQFLQIPATKIHLEPDILPDPKAELIHLARQSPIKALRQDLVPEAKSSSKVGKGYNARLGAFIHTQWNIHHALAHSPSLARAVSALRGFSPSF